MADERKIVIELKNISGTSGNGKSGEKNEELSDKISKVSKTLLNPISTLEKNILAKNVIVGQATQLAINSVKQIGQYHIYKYFTLNEDYINETNYQNMMTGINKTVSLGASVAGGAITGAAAGPVGAVIGASIGLVGWSVSNSLQNEKNYFSQQIQINQNNYQSQFQQTRLGLIDGRGVTNQ